MTATPIAEDISTKVQRIAQLAREAPERAFLSLSHYIDESWLKEAYRRTRKDGAPGIDGLSAREYERELDSRLAALLNGFKSGRYKAPPVRRVHIPKGDGRSTRPIGIPTLEDKLLQRAVLMVLEAVYDQDFLDCSYGFRPGRGAHDALKRLRQGLQEMGGGWVLEVDIKSYFDSIDHAQLRKLLDRRVRDGVLRRMIDKWLAAGVLEDGSLHHPEAGTPQGGVISPLLANIYLHEVLDKWFEREVRPGVSGRAFLVRYADDFVLVFSTEAEARRVMAALQERLQAHGLTIHPDKTRLFEFRPRSRGQGRDDEPRGFDFLGLQHHWMHVKKGGWVVQRTTASSRVSRVIRRLGLWCRRNRHRPIREQHLRLAQALRGHYNYFNCIGNLYALWRVRHLTIRIWRSWLQRRSQGRHMPWKRFQHVLRRFPLPVPLAANPSF
jgi:group II intron reverse transcriptase/maturase